MLKLTAKQVTSSLPWQTAAADPLVHRFPGIDGRHTRLMARLRQVRQRACEGAEDAVQASFGPSSAPSCAAAAAWSGTSEAAMKKSSRYSVDHVGPDESRTVRCCDSCAVEHFRD